jgi:transcription termination factor NusA
MSFEPISEASVKSPKDMHPRRGRGFSRKEIQEANLSVGEARRFGLIVDLRRKSFYEDNVEVLKAYVEEMKQLLSAKPAKPAPSETKESEIAELSSMKSVTKAHAKLLVDAGISTIEDLAYCEIDTVARKTGIDEDQITKMVKESLKKV